MRSKLHEKAVDVLVDIISLAQHLPAATAIDDQLTLGPWRCGVELVSFALA